VRRAALAFTALVALSTGAAAQIPAAPNTVPGTEANSFPVINMPASRDTPADHYRHLPYRDLATSIRIQLSANALYDFDRAEVRQSAADYLQQAANLIFEQATGPVRVECRSDRGAQAEAQKLGAQCAAALAQWLTVQEKLTKVKFVTVGTGVPPPAAPDSRDLMPQNAPSQSDVVIDFAKK
jgi:outer membrane protein OmpA-like peptidoglycan-associated protein